MAKGSRSNRKKALRSVRREKVTATWQEEAERARMEALQRCLEAPPVPLSEAEMARIEEAKAAPPKGARGDAMDADGDAGGGGSGKRRGKKGRRGVAVGGKKGRKKIGGLSKLSGNRFHKAKGKRRK